MNSYDKLLHKQKINKMTEDVAYAYINSNYTTRMLASYFNVCQTTIVNYLKRAREILPYNEFKQIENKKKFHFEIVRRGEVIHSYIDDFGLSR